MDKTNAPNTSAAEGTISLNSTILATKEQVSSDLSGEAVILHLQSGVYFGLNEVGARIWKIIQEPRTVNSIKEALLDEYEVDPEECEKDLLALIEELKAANLIEVMDEAAV